MAETLLHWKLTNFAKVNFAARTPTRKCYVHQVKNIVAFWTQILLQKHVYLSLKKFSSGTERATMADHKVRVESHKPVIELGKERKEMEGREKREILIGLYDCLKLNHEDCMDKHGTKSIYCQIDAQMLEEYGITRGYYKSKNYSRITI